MGWSRKGVVQSNQASSLSRVIPCKKAFQDLDCVTSGSLALMVQPSLISSHLGIGDYLTVRCDLREVLLKCGESCYSCTAAVI